MKNAENKILIIVFNFFKKMSCFLMVLLLSWGVFFFINERVLAANAPFLPEPPSHESWSATETYNPQWLETKGSLEDAVTRTVFSDFARSTDKGVEDAAAEQEEALLFNGGSFEKGFLSATKKGKVASVLPGFVKKLSLSMRVMLLAGILLMSLKMISTPKGKDLLKVVTESIKESVTAPEEAAPLKKEIVHFDAPIVGARIRLERIRTLLPAATRLAAAADTDESMRFLKIVQQAVKNADARTAGIDQRKEALEDCVERALTGLHWLQDSAFRAAKELVAVEPSPPDFPLLNFWKDKRDAEFVQKIKKEADAPVLGMLLQTSQTLQKWDKALSRQFTERANVALAGRKFEDEHDEASLLDTAGALEFMRDTSKTRRRFAAVAKKMNDEFFTGVKNITLGYHVGEARAIEGSMASILLYKKALLSESVDVDPEKKNSLNQIIQGFEKIDDLFERLRPLRKAMRDATSVSSLSAADEKAGDLEREAYEWISMCKKAAERLQLPSAPLETHEKKLVIKRAEMAHQLLNVYSIQTLYVVKELRETADKTAADAEERLSNSSNAHLARKQLEEANEVEKEMADRTYKGMLSLDTVKQTDDLVIAINELAKMNELMYSHQENKLATQIIKMSSSFLKAITEEVDQAAVESMRLGPQIPASNRSSYKELLKSFNAARKRFRDSLSLLEAAQAADDVRTHFIALRNLVLENTKKPFYQEFERGERPKRGT